MDYLKKFVIPFRGLKLGVHHFDFEIDDKFFEAVESAEIEHGRVSVGVDLTKQERMLILEFGIEGMVEVSCDRCLEPLEMPVKGNERLIVKFGENRDEESDEVIIIPESDHQINISQYLYEFISLLLPMQKIHPDDEHGNSTCNPDMLERLGRRDGEKQTDPRWDVLKKLKK
ncbi:MAG: YceD family protein [Bacteroidales bacterium]